MEIEPENKDQEQQASNEQAQSKNNNEDLAKEIPTVTPDDDNENPELEGENQ